MPGEDDFSADVAGPKSQKKSNWRGKLFPKDKASKNVPATTTTAATEQQLDDFLGSTRSKTLPDVGVTASQEWPTNLDTPLPPGGNSTGLSKKKQPRRKGLKVAFSHEEPEVIGEGGDESEEPTVEISIRRHQNDARAAVPQEDEEQHRHPSEQQIQVPALVVDTSLTTANGGRGEQRTEEAWTPLLQNMKDADFLLALSQHGPGSRLSLRVSPDPNSFARRIQAKMQAEEGQALQRRADLAVAPPNTETAIEGGVGEGEGKEKEEESPPQQSPPLASPAFAAQSPAITAQSVAGTSLDGTPRSSLTENSVSTAVLEPRRKAVPVKENPTVPAILSPGGSPQKRSPPRATMGVRDLEQETHPRLPTREVKSEPSPPPSKLSLRSVAITVGDNALTEFTTQVARYYTLFRLAAESQKPLMEISLPEWIRAATWWFLKGRSNLEASVRSRSTTDRTDEGLRQRRFVESQAVADLGKSWWICQYMVPEHQGVMGYGKMDMDALLAVVRTTGDQRLAELLSVHQRILRHLRLLTMSMNRNRVLPAVGSADELVDPRLDTSLWVRYPSFAVDVAAVLSGSTMKSMLIDEVARPASNMAEMMLLGDNTQFFSYGSMFVNMHITSGDDNSRQYGIPCVLSIMRNRTDSYVLAAIASQSDLVNIMIQSDRTQGPTWDDVEWQVKLHALKVKLPRGFELNLVFREIDFKMLWNIIKYTLKVQESLQPGAGETSIFETTLTVFEYTDPSPPTAFPAEPSRSCTIRLFEKSLTVNEGSRTRKTYRGFRLAVVTNPTVKTLSSVGHELGYGAPIVFGYLRGENGAPALLLNVKENGRNCTMVMTFKEIQERTTMHSLLMGMVPSEDEFQIPDIPLRSFSIEQPADRKEGSLATTHLQFTSGSLSIIDQEVTPHPSHAYGPTVFSEHLRVVVTTDWGTVTDRINLGQIPKIRVHHLILY